MTFFRVHPLAVLGAAFLTVMCSGATDHGSSPVSKGDAKPDEGVEAGSDLCAPASFKACTCDSGNSGVVRCSPSGSWGACDCSGEECSEQDVSTCTPPASQCRDGVTLRFFVNPTCRAGRCNWEEQYYSCSSCSNGGCLGTGTTGGGPSFDASADASGTDSGTKIECRADDVTRCTPPPSECVSTTVLRYYVNPTCSDGRCRWQTQQYSCAYCMGGGCLGTTTAGGAGP